MVKRYNNGKIFSTLLFCIIYSLAIIPGNANSQTLIFLETFGNTTPGACDQGTLANGFVSSNGTWTVTNVGYNYPVANEWFISAAEPGLPVNSCSLPGCWANSIYTKKTLHVGNVPNSINAATLCATGDCGAVYDPGGFQGGTTSKRAETPAFLMPSTGQNLLVFNYIDFADTPIDSDLVLIYFYDGSSWSSSPIVIPPRTPSCGNGSSTWEQFSTILPVIPAPANVKIGFLWKNDSGAGGTNPSFAVDSIIVFNLNTPVANITVSDTDICSNTCIDFFTGTAGPGAIYEWMFTGAATSTSTQQNPSSVCYNNPGTFPVQLIVTTPGGSDTATASIIVNPCIIPTADFAASDTVFCERSCITFADLSTNGATGWNWLFPGGTPSSGTSPSPPPVCYYTPGFYDVTLIVFNQFGSDTLVKTSYMKVDSCPLPVADYTSVPVQFCPQYCVSFTDNSTNGPITSYQWYFPGALIVNSTSPNPVICYTSEGLYDVYLIVTNQYGSDTIIRISDVNAQFIPGGFASQDTEMFVGSSYQLNAGGGISYLWAPSTGLDDVNIPNPVASPSVTTTYTVSIDDGSGCISKRQVKITVLHDNAVFVPNAFSPNGDGRNEYLFVRGNNFSSIIMTIYDRWGEKVFETTNSLIGWDGTYKGNQLDPGVFTYVLTISYADKSIVTQSGSVTLVR